MNCKRLFGSLTLIIISLLFVGCMGTMSEYDKTTGMYQMHTFDNSVMNTSSKLTQYFQCRPGLEVSGNEITKELPENCTKMGVYHSDTTGFAPSVGAPALTGVVGAALIADGIKHSGDTINNSNNDASSQTNVQSQGINGSGSCSGNCGGKGRR